LFLHPDTFRDFVIGKNIHAKSIYAKSPAIIHFLAFRFSAGT